MRILYVTEDKTAAQRLRDKGFIVEIARTEHIALDWLGSYGFDCIVASVPVADMRTARFITNVRDNQHTTPILIDVSDGCGDSETATAALDAGADDYIKGRCSDEEVAARVRALVRRSQGVARSTVQIDDLTCDLLAKQVFRADGSSLHLTGKEYELFELLALRRGKVVSKDVILEHMYQQRDEPDMKIIDVFIYKINKKTDKLIQNVWGRGYTIPAPKMSRTESSIPHAEAALAPA